MRFFNSLFVFCITGAVLCCSHTPQHKPVGADTTVRRECFAPVEFRVDRDFSKQDRETIIRGFLHWNKVLGREVYAYGGLRGLEPGLQNDYLPVVKTETEDGWCGLTRTRQLGNKCIYGHDVQLDVSRYACYADGRFESVVRHEAGHALGLEHQQARQALMFYAIQEDQKHPRPVSKKERDEVLRRLP